MVSDIGGPDGSGIVAGTGKVSWVLLAIDQIQRWNQYGKHLLIHGANISLGYDFNPRWFACGKSPLCVEIDRLVRSGVVVVVSAGNGGYSAQSGYNNLSITDGRLKPDVIAPGERIISCAAGRERSKYSMPGQDDVMYCELSGTSMAAPHVSGAIAAFLSVRNEYIGEPEDVKNIFTRNAVDMRRERSFQGAGLIDLMKVLQSV